MKRPLSARIAWRYLCAKKSHSAVGAISAVSICGIAVATAAIICVLSVFNGFKAVISDRLDTLAPDIMVTAAEGKVIENADSLADALAGWKEIKAAVPSILDNALAISNGHETPILLKGVDRRKYSEVTIIDRLMIDSLTDADTPSEDISAVAGVASVGLAGRLGIYPGSNLLIFAPRRVGRLNTANPAASFLTDSVFISNIYRANQADYDDNRLIVDLDVARGLLQYDTEATAVEIRLQPDEDATAIAQKIEATSHGRLIAKDRMRQQEMNFRMISIEKWVSFLLLFFILLIASFNIISSLSMIVLEKEKSMSTLAALGMSRQQIGSIFSWESILVTAVGGLSGIIIGITLCLLQQHFGFIRLQGDPSSLVVTAYPVAVKFTDILITLIPLSVVGIATAIITDIFSRSRLSNAK